MLRKFIKILISLIATLLGLALLAYGVSKSSFNNLKKYDDGSNSSHSGLKEQISKNKYYTTKTKVNSSNNMANLGDFTVNISNNKKLITNLSFKFVDSKKGTWTLDDGLKDEILQKSDILRSVVIDTVSNTADATVKSRKMKKDIINNINKHLSKGKITEVYFNKFITQ